ncbi:Translation initiation factor 3 subunit b [Mortierella antarctica]|nr:Translation initiation factor 3 subunit b [Mortierella antarctica]
MTCQHCSIIPSYILKDIAENSNVQAVRDIATKSFAHVADIHHARTSTQGKGPAALGISPAAGPTPKPLDRYIYDAQQKDIEDLSGILVFRENDASLQNLTDESIKNVHGHFQKVFDFYQKVFKRNSFDDQGAKLIISVHFDGDPEPGYDNAFWLPNQDPKLSQWCFGDGDFVLFNNFTNILDISAHEFTHAVVEYTGILPYVFQSGALNESMADVFGSMIKQFFAPGGPQKAKDADWLIGEGLFLVPGGRALRDMENPGTAYNIPGVTRDRQQRNYQDIPLWDDDGGVHINSSIPNRAFVLVAKKLGGFSWDVAGPIWYASLTDPRLREIFTRNGVPIRNRAELIRRSKDTFMVFANLTIKHAQARWPAAVEAVRSAWTEVGVLE